MEGLLTIILVTFVHIPNGESMISSQRRHESPKTILHAQYQHQSGRGLNPENLSSALLRNTPYQNYGWKIKNHNARSAVRTVKRKYSEIISPPSLLNMQDTINVDKGSPFFRKGRLIGSEDDDDQTPNAPDPDPIASDSSENNPPPPPPRKPHASDNADDEAQESDEDNTGGGPPPPPSGSGGDGGESHKGPVIIDLNGTIYNGGQSDVDEGGEDEDDEDEGESSTVEIDFSDEIGDRIAALLCSSLIDNGYLPNHHDHSNKTGGLRSSYLWVPIRQYISGFSRGIVLDAPVYAPGCFKWQRKKCGGDEFWPLLTPCTYWAPMQLEIEACGFSEQPKRYIQVVGRPENMEPGHCMCDWPCIPYFDPFQRCRVEVPNMPTIPKYNYKVSHNEALQLCRGVAQVHLPFSPIRIPYIPVRVINGFHSLDVYNIVPTPCFSWEYTHCAQEGDFSCGIWKRGHRHNDCQPEQPAPKRSEDFAERKLKSKNGEPVIRRLSQDLRHKTGCRCAWPCLPFFEPINKCYDTNGDVLRQENGKLYVPAVDVNFKDQGYMQCTHFSDKENILCRALTPHDMGDDALTSHATSDETDDSDSEEDGGGGGGGDVGGGGGGDGGGGGGVSGEVGNPTGSVKIIDLNGTVYTR